MKNKIRVMIVDDQSISRRFFEMVLNASERYKVVFTAHSAFALDAYFVKRKIDLVLMDVLMDDGSNGLDAAEKIKSKYPAIKIIVVTSMPEYNWMERAREIGVESFWYKETDEISILDVIDRTVAGESVYPANAPSALLGNARRDDFTERELDVLRVLSSGKSNNDIAKALNISPFTVKAHIRTLLQKTGYDSRTELAVHARVVGIALDPNSKN